MLSVCLGVLAVHDGEHLVKKLVAVARGIEVDRAVPGGILTGSGMLFRVCDVGFGAVAGKHQNSIGSTSVFDSVNDGGAECVGADDIENVLCVGVRGDLTQTVTAVNTVDELKTAINNGGYIVLNSDVTISESLEIPTDKNISVDLNGKKISSNRPVFQVKGTLEINGTGAIISDSNAIQICGGKCTLNGGDVFSTGKNRAVVYMEQNDTGVPTFIMNGGSLTLDRQDGMGFSLGTNNVSSSPSVAVINGGVLNGAIYWPISGSLTIGRVGGSNSDVTVSGKMALLACCGTVTINCGTFNSTMDGTDSHDTTEWVQENSTSHSGIPGYTGDAVMLVTGRSIGYAQYPLNVVINDGVFISDGVEYGLRIVDCNNVEQEVNITINGGTYTGGELGPVDYSAAKKGSVVDNRTNK